jgi:myo-inositol-1(or 4)-monophosphatase
MITSARASIKNNSELVTQFDSQCQSKIIEHVNKYFPGHGFVAEEGAGGKVFKQAPTGEPFWWVIDPIDGTNNYAHGVLCFTVSIGVIYRDRPVAAVIFDPNTNAMFTATLEGPALFNGSPIQTGSEGINEYASLAIDSHFEDRFTPAICKLIQDTRFRNFGTTTLHMAYVAKAGLVGMMASNAKLWDIAAGSLIVERAGAIASNWQGNAIFPIDMDTYNGGLFDILASNKTVHKELVNILNRK